MSPEDLLVQLAEESNFSTGSFRQWSSWIFLNIGYYEIINCPKMVMIGYNPARGLLWDNITGIRHNIYDAKSIDNFKAGLITIREEHEKNFGKHQRKTQ